MPYIFSTAPEKVKISVGYDQATTRADSSTGKQRPRAEHRVLGPLGHMGPITHPEVVNAEIEHFLLAAT